MDFLRNLPRKYRATRKADTSVEEIQSHSYISQPEVPPKAYTLNRQPALALCKSGTKKVRVPLKSAQQQLPEKLSIGAAESVDEAFLLDLQECEKITILEVENEQLRIENARLKANLKEESIKYMLMFKYCIDAEEELGKFLKVYQSRRWENADHEADNNGGSSEEEII